MRQRQLVSRQISAACLRLQQLGNERAGYRHPTGSSHAEWYPRSSAKRNFQGTWLGHQRWLPHLPDRETSVAQSKSCNCFDQPICEVSAVVRPIVPVSYTPRHTSSFITTSPVHRPSHSAMHMRPNTNRRRYRLRSTFVARKTLPIRHVTQQFDACPTHLLMTGPQPIGIWCGIWHCFRRRCPKLRQVVPPGAASSLSPQFRRCDSP